MVCCVHSCAVAGMRTSLAPAFLVVDRLGGYTAYLVACRVCAASLTTMIGHSWARELLDRAAARGRLSHAYLFSGPASVGKTALATYLGSMLVCANPTHAPCGICRSCRLVARGVHPDVQVVTRAEDRRNLTVDQVRAIEDSIGLAPFEARQKLICLDGADLLNDAAASALLKTLEEPPAHAMLVLCAADPLALPAPGAPAGTGYYYRRSTDLTVRSRAGSRGRTSRAGTRSSRMGDPSAR